MATYKVLQDIEAEDKIIGPLTLKQFIFAIITIVFIFATIFLGRVNIVLAIPWIIPIFFFGFMAAPIGKDQPNDVWLAARIRFLIKPRKRIWDQAGMQELVTITAPKKIERNRTDGLSQTEVRGRLSALSSLMDTRGWAVKDVAVSSMNTFNAQNVMSGERLFDLAPAANEFAVMNPSDSEDVLDEMHNSTAQRIDTAIKSRQSSKIETLKQQMKSGLIGANNQKTEQTPQNQRPDYSFINKEPVNIEPGYATFGDKVITPGTKKLDEDIMPVAQVETRVNSADEEELLNRLHRNKELQETINESSHDHRINPIKTQPATDGAQGKTANDNNAPNAIIKQLGQANDLSVASIADLAKHAESEVTLADDDVVSLH